MVSSPDDNGSPSVRSAEAARVRPGRITTAVVLIVVSAVVWAPIAGQLTAVTAPSAVLLFCYVLFAARAGGGRRRARNVVSITAVLLYVVLAPYAWLGFQDPSNLYGPEYAVMDIVALIASGVGTLLLYAPSTDAYFRGAPKRTP